MSCCRCYNNGSEAGLNHAIIIEFVPYLGCLLFAGKDGGFFILYLKLAVTVFRAWKFVTHSSFCNTSQYIMSLIFDK